MKLEEQVCSLELSKNLLIIGVKQESEFFHCFASSVGAHKLEREVHLIVHKSQLEGMSERWVSAFTVAELLDLLPEKVDVDDYYKDLHLIVRKEVNFYEGWNVKYSANYFTEMDKESNGAHLPDCLAKMLIYLIENKLMEVPK